MSVAFAAPAQQGSNMLMTMLPLLLVFLVMYFLMIRPQQKRAAEHQKLINSMKRGDKVVTNSGIIGVISRVKDAEFIIEVAENINMSFLKNAIAGPYSGDVAKSEVTETAPKSDSGGGTSGKAKRSKRK
ncbi:MAG: preprotein translocase subunit YajC [Holosporales bacterium]|jgi:preprotein translocase subunit YajC|nr:preprotein translocase subunit YajC [Holosporales bacterium]